jgi:hypothetical protein
VLGRHRRNCSAPSHGSNTEQQRRQRRRCQSRHTHTHKQDEGRPKLWPDREAFKKRPRDLPSLASEPQWLGAQAPMFTAGLGVSPPKPRLWLGASSWLAQTKPISLSASPARLAAPGRSRPPFRVRVARARPERIKHSLVHLSTVARSSAAPLAAAQERHTRWTAQKRVSPASIRPTA